MSKHLAKRIKSLQQNLSSHQAIFLTHPSHIYYFSGFEFLVPEEKEAYLVITTDQAFLIHGSFNAVPQHNLTQNLAGLFPNQLLAHLDHIKQQTAVTQLLVDKNYLYLSEANLLEEIGFKLEQLDLVWLDQLRMIKDQPELAALQTAGQIAAQAWEQIQPLIKPGLSELELSNHLKKIMFELGSSREAFPTIVAFGAHTALPHHQPTASKLTPETAVLFDFGATYQSYRSDMTRSFWFGENPDPEYQHIHQTVNQAYQAVLDQLKTWTQTRPHPELTAQDLDNTARDLISKAGYEKEFIHTTGHGIGLDIHEYPSLNWNNQVPLSASMVFTIEPGIYLPERFGVRYENTIHLADSVTELTVI